MGTGKTTDNKLDQIERMIKTVPGDLAEIGVAMGGTFYRLVPIAKRRGCEAHAFDSFMGMDTPGPKDDPSLYPKSKFNQGGPDGFAKMMDDYGIVREDYHLWAGYVPHCFDGAEKLRFAFVYLDLDVYAPSQAALAWLWPRLHEGGILMVDDYWEVGGPDGRVIDAINEWLPSMPDAFKIECENNQLIIKKGFIR